MLGNYFVVPSQTVAYPESITSSSVPPTIPATLPPFRHPLPHSGSPPFPSPYASTSHPPLPSSGYKGRENTQAVVAGRKETHLPIRHWAVTCQDSLRQHRPREVDSKGTLREVYFALFNHFIFFSTCFSSFCLKTVLFSPSGEVLLSQMSSLLLSVRSFFTRKECTLSNKVRPLPQVRRFSSPSNEALLQMKFFLKRDPSSPSNEVLVPQVGSFSIK